MLHDLRYAIRGFTAHPGFTLAAVLSLALGIGANAALFSVTSALLLRPLPYKNADRLVILWQRSPGLNIAEDWFSPHNISTSGTATPASSTWQSRSAATTL